LLSDAKQRLDGATIVYGSVAVGDVEDILVQCAENNAVGLI